MYPGTHAATHPDKVALIVGRSGETLSYRELDERSARLARLLHDRGLRPGDKIAILAENHPRYFEVYWAALRSGLYLTAVSRYLSPEEAGHIVDDSESTALITTAAQSSTASGLLERVPGCRLRLMMDGASPGFEPYEDLIASYSPERLPDQPKGDVMLYSSGTTGRPKGIRRPLSGLQVDDPTAYGMGAFEGGLLGMDETSVYLCPAPLYHAAALSWSAGVHELGGTVVVMERFDAEGFLEIIQRERVTHTQVVPTMLVRIMKLDPAVRAGYDLSSLQLVVHAAAPCPVELKRQVIDWLGPIVSEYYAGTEGSGLTYLTTEEWLAHPGSVGRPIVGTPRICADDGTLLPAGEVGIVYFEQPVTPFEYHRDPDKTRASRHPEHDNWSGLGDIGYLDDDGYLYLTDRRGFTIISGGVNIYPAEIESCLVMHPSVADVAVIGLPDPEMGEYVLAVVQPVEGVEEGPELGEELRSYARQHLAGYKVPRRVDFRPDLPRLPTGKLQKQVLKDDYAAAQA